MEGQSADEIEEDDHAAVDGTEDEVMAVMHRRQVMVLMMSLLVTREFQKNFVYSISLAIF